MGKIFKNMVPYWKPLIAVLLLLFVQAWCDLSLPEYTSDIIDVGIINNGVEHVIPEAVTAEEYEKAMILMTVEEKAAWESCFVRENDRYVRSVSDRETLEEMDETLLLSLLMNQQMSAVTEEEFRQMLAGLAGDGVLVPAKAGDIVEIFRGGNNGPVQPALAEQLFDSAFFWQHRGQLLSMLSYLFAQSGCAHTPWARSRYLPYGTTTTSA